MARALGLIVVPAFVYLSFFYIHFSSLPKSGSGDNFMSPAFQETLRGNEMLLNSQGIYIYLYGATTLIIYTEIRYYYTVTIKHKETKVYRHSHKERYPLKYEDGRISSQGKIQHPVHG